MFRIELRKKKFLLGTSFFLFLSQALYFVGNSVYHELLKYYQLVYLFFIFLSLLFFTSFICDYFTIIKNKTLFIFDFTIKFFFVLLFFYFYVKKLINSPLFFDFDTQSWIFSSVFRLKYLYIAISGITLLIFSNVVFSFFTHNKDKFNIFFLSFLGLISFLSLPFFSNIYKIHFNFKISPFFSLAIFLAIFICILNISKKSFLFEKLYFIFAFVIFAIFIFSNYNLYKRTDRYFHNQYVYKLFNSYFNITKYQNESYRLSFNKNKESFYFRFKDKDFNLNFSHLKITLSNSWIYNSINLLNNENFSRNIFSILNNSPQTFVGYKTVMLDFLENLDKKTNIKQKFATKLMDTNQNVRYIKRDLEIFFDNHQNDSYCKNIYKFLENNRKASIYISPILKHIQDKTCSWNHQSYQRKSFHINLINYFQPIGNNHFNIQRSSNVKNYLSFVYYNNIENEIGEVGIDYILYRKNMHEVFIPQLIILFMVTFVVFVLQSIFLSRKRQIETVKNKNKSTKLETQDQDRKTQDDFHTSKKLLSNFFSPNQKQKYIRTNLKVYLNFNFSVLNRKENSECFHIIDDFQVEEKTSYMFFAFGRITASKEDKNEVDLTAINVVYSLLFSYILNIKKDSNLFMSPEIFLKSINKQTNEFIRFYNHRFQSSISILLLDEITFESWSTDIGIPNCSIIYRDCQAYGIKNQSSKNSLVSYNRLFDKDKIIFIFDKVVSRETLNSIENIYGSLGHIKFNSDLNKNFISELEFHFKDKQFCDEKFLTEKSRNKTNRYLSYQQKKKEFLKPASGYLATLWKEYEKSLREKKIKKLLSPSSFNESDYKIAVDTLTKYFDSNENIEIDEYLFYCALFYKNDNQQEKSIEFALKFEKLYPGHLPNLLILVDLYYIQENFDSCLKYIKKILLLQSNHFAAIQVMKIVNHKTQFKV